MTKTYHTDEEVQTAIRNIYPELPGAGQNLLRMEVFLRSIGSSTEKVMDSMTVDGSPFLKLS
jgi:hypothetical protein